MTAASIALALFLSQQTSPPGTSAAPPEANPTSAPPPAASVPSQQASVLTLRDAIELARRRNLDIQQVDARVEQARQLAWKAWSYYLPQVALSGSYMRNQLEADISLPVGYYVSNVNTPGPPGVPPSQQTTYQATVPSTFVTDAVQTLNEGQAQAAVNQALVAPSVWSGIANAYTAQRAVEYNAQQARRDVLFSIAELYYGIAGLKQLVIVQERQVELTRERERDARVRFNAGTSPKVGLLRAQIDRAQAEEDLKRSQIDYLRAKLSLAAALDRDENFEIANPRSPEPPQGQNLQQQALDLRPDVKAAVENVRLAEGQRTQFYMQYLPNIGAFFKYLYSNVTIFTGQLYTWQAGVGLTWNILDGGLREASIREANAKVVEAKAAQESVDLRVTTNVKQFQLDLEAALANRAKAQERTDLARENARLVEVAYKAGAATYLESTDSIQTLRQAEVTLVAESLNVDLATVRLLNAVGAFQEVNN